MERDGWQKDKCLKSEVYITIASHTPGFENQSYEETHADSFAAKASTHSLARVVTKQVTVPKPSFIKVKRVERLRRGSCFYKYKTVNLICFGVSFTPNLVAC